jgi:hypothetical protein
MHQRRVEADRIGTERMADTKKEAQWRATFEAEGETAIRDAMNFRSVPYPEPMRQSAFKWLREQEALRKRRKNQMRRAAVVVGVVGVAVTWTH